MGRMRIAGSTPKRRATRTKDIVGPWAEDAMLALMSETNLLLHGDERAVAFALGWLAPVLEPPLMTWQAGKALNLPTGGRRGTLVLRNVAALTPTDQFRLDAWLRQPPRATRVVSTTTQSIVPLIATGAFLEGLYYRINTVVVSVTAP
jgi:hypothetical protein